MKSKNGFIFIFLTCLIRVQLHAGSLDSLLNKSDSISRSLEKRTNLSHVNKNVRSVLEEICFYSDLKIRIISNLKDSLFLESYKPLKDELISFISEQRSLVKIIDSCIRQQNSLPDLQTARRISSVTDTVYATLEKMDGIIKSKTDSIYANAISIRNHSKTREIILMTDQVENTILIISWFMMLIFLTLFMGLTVKHKFKSHFTCTSIGLAIISGFLILRPSVLYPITGRKTTIPAWEYHTIEGHRLNSMFMKQCKEGRGGGVLSKTAVNAFLHYYMAAYTSVNANHIKDMYLNIHLMSSVLYPPASMPDSAAIAGRKNDARDFDPAWFSEYNFSKIKYWNRMQSRGNVHGEMIDRERYNDRLNELIHCRCRLEEFREDGLKTKTPASRMKLDLLLKVKAVL